MEKNIKALEKVSLAFVCYLFATTVEADPFDNNNSDDELIAEVSANYENYAFGHAMYLAITSDPIKEATYSTCTDLPSFSEEELDEFWKMII